ncbi:MAG: transcriptional regulator GcvA [Burkholderiales bacterium]
MHNRAKLPSLDLLKAFEASARHLSFTKAGEDLFLSQSAISRQIQMLEEQLGIPLFHRRTRALALTDAGWIYFNEISKVLDRLREVTAKIMASPASDAVLVSTVITFASLWLVPRLSALQNQHPGLRIHLAADNKIVDLQREQFDVAIRYSTRKIAGTGAQKLFGETVVPVCSPKLVARGTLKSTDNLREFVLLDFVDPTGRGPWLTWSHWFEAVGANAIRGKGSVQFSHYDQAIRAAIAGQGIALARLPLIMDMLDAGQLVTPFKSKRYTVQSEERAYWLIVSPSSAGRQEVNLFTEWLKDQAAARNTPRR